VVNGLPVLGEGANEAPGYDTQTSQWKKGVYNFPEGKKSKKTSSTNKIHSRKREKRHLNKTAKGGSHPIPVEAEDGGKGTSNPLRRRRERREERRSTLDYWVFECFSLEAKKERTEKVQPVG